MIFKFNILKNGVVETVKIPAQENWKRFALYRNMMADLGDIDSDIELDIINDDRNLHPEAYNFIIKLCDYLDDNDITDKNWEDFMNVTSTYTDSLLMKYIIDLFDNLTNNTFLQKTDKSNDIKLSMCHDILNIINFTECDNNKSKPYILDIMCCYYASKMLK